ncbi:MAG: hypothetical protein ACR2JW_03595 [Thermomicrobiales bacterium]
MTAKRILWAVNGRDGRPFIVKGVLADIDQTGQVTISNRVSEIVAEVLTREPSPTEMFAVPGIDLAHEVYQLVQAKHAAGIPVHDPLPPKEASNSGAAPANTARTARYNELIDAILTSVYSEMQSLSANLTGKTLETIELDELRHGHLGQALYQLAEIATGDEQASSQKYFELVDYIERFTSTMLSKEDRALFDEMVQKAQPHAAVV